MTRKTEGSDLVIVGRGIRIDLVRTADGKSTADDPLTVSNVSAEIDELADRIEVIWPDVPPLVAHHVDFCSWRLRELSQSIAHPNGIVIAWDTTGRVHFPAPPGTLDLLGLLGQAMNICQRLKKGWPRPAGPTEELPPQDKLRNLAKLIATEVRRRTGGDDPDEERNQWLYEQWQYRRKTRRQIIEEFGQIRATKGWRKISGVSGIQKAVAGHAKLKNLPLRRGPAGRPKKAK